MAGEPTKLTVNPLYNTPLQKITAITLLNFKAPVDTEANLPTTGNDLYDVRIATDTGVAYYWDGTQWVEIGDIFDIHWSAIIGKPSSPVGEIDDAVSKRHVQNTDTKVDEGGANETTAAEIRNAADKAHDAATAGDGIEVGSGDLTSGQIYNASSAAPFPNDAGTAFDDIFGNGNDSGGWRCDIGTTNQWVSVQFSTANIVDKIEIRNGAGFSPNRGAKNCKLEGSNNGSTWTKIPAVSATIATIVNIDEFQLTNDNDTIWQIINFTNTTPYLYYRLFVFDNWGDPFLAVKEIAMFSSLGQTITNIDKGTTAVTTHEGANDHHTQNTDVQIITNTTKVRVEQSPTPKVLIEWTGQVRWAFQDNNLGVDQNNFYDLGDNTNQLRRLYVGELRTQGDTVIVSTQNAKDAYDHSLVTSGNPHNLDTGDVTEVTDKNYVTDLDITNLGNLSGINTGDEPDSSTSAKGIIELATQGEVDAGTDTVRAVTPATLANYSGLGGEFGSQFQQASSDAQSSTNSTTYQQKLRMTTGSLPSGTYRIAWYWELAASSTSDDWEGRVQINDTNTIGEVRWEPKEAGTDNWRPASGFYYYTGSGVLNIDIDYRTDDDDRTVYIKRARLEIWKVS